VAHNKKDFRLHHPRGKGAPGKGLGCCTKLSNSSSGPSTRTYNNGSPAFGLRRTHR
jgi:hypothetical protein